jgi:hypothetical protein
MMLNWTQPITTSFFAHWSRSMTDLSPPAQAVLDAAMQYEINPECYSREIAAAALRAAADQVVPVEHEIIDNCWYEKADLIREQFLAIATELEAQ